MADPTPQLLGRGTYGPDRLPRLRGPRHLWNHVSMPPMQNSIIIYKNGTVREGNNFQPWEYDPVQAPDVHRYILGGANANLETLDQFSIDSLIAAGYTFGHGATMDVYLTDYTNTYPLVAGVTHADAAAAAARVKAERIAALEAELAALKGTP